MLRKSFIFTIVTFVICFRYLVSCGGNEISTTNRDGGLRAVGSNPCDLVPLPPDFITNGCHNETKRIIIYADAEQPLCYYQTVTTWTESRTMDEGALFKQSKLIAQHPIKDPLKHLFGYPLALFKDLEAQNKLVLKTQAEQGNAAALKVLLNVQNKMGDKNSRYNDDRQNMERFSQILANYPDMTKDCTAVHSLNQ